MNADTMDLSNLYAFGNGDPINNTDPSGHFSVMDGVGLALDVVGAIAATVTTAFTVGASTPVAVAAWISVATAIAATGADVGRIVAQETGNDKAASALGYTLMALGGVSGVTGIGAATSAGAKNFRILKISIPNVERATELNGMTLSAMSIEKAGEVAIGDVAAITPKRGGRNLLNYILGEAGFGSGIVSASPPHPGSIAMSFANDAIAYLSLISKGINKVQWIFKLYRTVGFRRSYFIQNYNRQLRNIEKLEAGRAEIDEFTRARA